MPARDIGTLLENEVKVRTNTKVVGLWSGQNDRKIGLPDTLKTEMVAMVAMVGWGNVNYSSREGSQREVDWVKRPINI